MADPKQLEALAIVQIQAIESEIQAIGNDLDEHRRVTREKLIQLNAARDRAADVLKAIRANLIHLIPPQAIAALGITTSEGIGTPGSGS